MTYFGIQSLLALICHTFFVCMTFWAMKSLRTDTWIKKHHIPQARVLYIFLSIAIGYTVSSFFIEFIASSQSLMHLF